MSQKYIGFEELISTIQDDLGFSIDKEYSRILRWCYEALWEVNGARVELVQKELTITNNKIKIPEDYVIVSNIYLVKNERCTEPTYVNLINCCHHYPTECVTRYEVSEQQDYFCFSSNVSNEFETALLIYFRIMLGEDNLPVIPQEMREFILAYVEYKWLKRGRNKHRYGPSRMNPVNLGDIDLAEQRYYGERRRARALLNSPSNWQETKQIMSDVLYDIPNTFPEGAYRRFRDYFFNYLPAG